MKSRFFSLAVLAACAGFLCLPVSSFAERPVDGIGKWLQEVGVFSGYLNGSLKRQKDMKTIPIGMRFGFDLKPFTKKLHFDPPGMLELVYEPYVGVIASPRERTEFGIPVNIKYAYPLTSKLYPYIEAGTGPYYTTLKTSEEATQYGFVDKAEAGLTYFLDDNWAVSASYEFRHVSNACIKTPNAGIESRGATVSLSYFF